MMPFLFLVLMMVPWAPGTASAAPASSYLQISGPCDPVLPRDHGPHPGYRTEWWYYTGNLRSEDGRPFGFQLTFFRSQISPPGSEESWPEPASAWRTQQVYLAHLAVSDIARQTFHHDERVSRGALSLAGAEATADGAAVHLFDWKAGIGMDRHRLEADSESFGIRLEAIPLKPLVAHGQRGNSRKGPRPEQASCYYSITRLQVQGQIRIGDETIAVSGLAWMDHEHSSAPLDADLVGWDWLSLQLDDGSELMVYLLRDRNGGYTDQSAGTFVTPQGNAVHLTRRDLEPEILERWESPRSQADYPLSWRIKIPSLEMDLRVVPRMRDQELHTPGSTRITYWEGSIAVEGRVKGRPAQGSGYMELTGYAQPLDSRL
ncbi:MAG: carotenoid 1,2-hydratase [Syntrophobacteraceae bacterium]|jgi:predicted secreted hydrolase|nr:carotenoid 1,2-hydratase [Syntrophobacteraceae bacterium]